MIYFPDVNIWVALVVGEHSHARRAQAWAEEAERDWIVLSRVTQMSLLRLLTNPHVMGADVVNGRGAWDIIDDLLRRQNIRFVPEPDDVEGAWRALTPAGRIGANEWTDAYLAAFARTTGFTLVTFDRGLSRYRDIPLRILPAQ
jgi:toxin-antitoxin system PIN domain toxin